MDARQVDAVLHLRTASASLSAFNEQSDATLRKLQTRFKTHTAAIERVRESLMDVFTRLRRVRKALEKAEKEGEEKEEARGGGGEGEGDGGEVVHAEDRAEE